MPQRAVFDRTPKGFLTYGLQEAPGKTVWLDSAQYLPLRLETNALGGDGSSSLTIEFGPYVVFGDQTEERRNLAFPQSVVFLLNGRLFKRTVLRDVDLEASLKNFPLARLREQAQRYRSVTAGRSGGS